MPIKLILLILTAAFLPNLVLANFAPSCRPIMKEMPELSHTFPIMRTLSVTENFDPIERVQSNYKAQIDFMKSEMLTIRIMSTEGKLLQTADLTFAGKILEYSGDFTEVIYKFGTADRSRVLGLRSPEEVGEYQIEFVGPRLETGNRLSYLIVLTEAESRELHRYIEEKYAEYDPISEIVIPYSRD